MSSANALHDVCGPMETPSGKHVLRSRGIHYLDTYRVGWGLHVEQSGGGLSKETTFKLKLDLKAAAFKGKNVPGRLGFLAGRPWERKGMIFCQKV